jgi:hypothetical protein
VTTKDSYEHLSIKMLDSQGGCCDCELLYDVAEFSRLKTDYWRNRTRRPNARAKHVSIVFCLTAGRKNLPESESARHSLCKVFSVAFVSHGAMLTRVARSPVKLNWKARGPCSPDST